MLLDNVTQAALDAQTTGLIQPGLYIFKIGDVTNIASSKTKSEAVKVS